MTGSRVSGAGPSARACGEPLETAPDGGRREMPVHDDGCVVLRGLLLFLYRLQKLRHDFRRGLGPFAQPANLLVGQGLHPVAGKHDPVVDRKTHRGRGVIYQLHLRTGHRRAQLVGAAPLGFLRRHVAEPHQLLQDRFHGVVGVQPIQTAGVPIAAGLQAPQRRIPDADPVGRRRFGYDAADQRASHAGIAGVLFHVLSDCRIGRVERYPQPRCNAAGRLAERVDEGRKRQVTGLGAPPVAAHPVGKDEQQIAAVRVLVGKPGDPEIVFLVRSRAGYLIARDEIGEPAQIGGP